MLTCVGCVRKERSSAEADATLFPRTKYSRSNLSCHSIVTLSSVDLKHTPLLLSSSSSSSSSAAAAAAADEEDSWSADYYSLEVSDEWPAFNFSRRRQRHALSQRHAPPHDLHKHCKWYECQTNQSICRLRHLNIWVACARSISLLAVVINSRDRQDLGLKKDWKWTTTSHYSLDGIRKTAKWCSLKIYRAY